MKNNVHVNKPSAGELAENAIRELENYRPMLGGDFAELMGWLRELRISRDSFGTLLLEWQDVKRTCDNLRYLEKDLELLLYETGAVRGLRSPRSASFVLAKALSKVLEGLEAQAGFEIKPLQRLVEEAEPIEYLCRPLLPKRSLVLLAGKAGAGKSLLCLHLAHAVASSTKVFDRFEVVENTRVLIIDEENGPPTYKERVQLLGLNPLDNIDCLCLTGFRLDSIEHLKFLERAIESMGYGLVILDNWTTIVSKIDENKAIEVSGVLSPLRRIAYRHDCSFVLIHHLRKSLPYHLVNELDELRGSSALVNEADLVYLVQVDSATEHRILKTVKNRHGRELAFKLAFETKEGRLAIKWAGEVEKSEVELVVVNCARAILDYVKSVGRARRSEILKVMEDLGYSRSTTDRALAYDLLTGRLKRVARGLYEPILPTHSEEVKEEESKKDLKTLLEELLKA